MTTGEALILLREKYIEEHDGISTGETTARYQDACRRFPVAMAVAHHCFALEKQKDGR